MDFSFSSIMSGFVFGVIGFWMMKQGKSRSNPLTIVIGIALIAYPYFISNIFLDWGIGIALCVLAYLKW